ncbi:MAG: Teichoic-acid-transporting ATPase [Phycisphaerales bacterium]|nr:Teichoic-acid-transporting ATPase [Phycisphaerales bacterium]
MPPAIQVENLSKCYRVNHAVARPAYRTLRESLTGALASSVQRLRKGLKTTRHEPFWALDDLSFEVQPGEVLGVIGRNGSGKSTLLKILSRITKPTTGRARIDGRVGSLLEVGTGFHPELSGRENIFLNGSILGMSRPEIRRKFDEIVAFAEVEQFLDMPVKRYSSGMYVRLAFSVAAHLEPEILIVDEVLAVGDAAYQRRCIDRMSALAAEGRTVLFVSHNMDVIPRLCSRALFLEKGRKVAEGPAADVLRRYMGRQTADAPDAENLTGKVHIGDGRAQFTRISHVDADGKPMPVHACGDDLILRLEIRSDRDIRDVALSVVIQTLQGARLISSWTREVDYRVDLFKGVQIYQCHFQRVRLRPGRRVYVQLAMATHNLIDCVEDAQVIEVTDNWETRTLSTESTQGAVVCGYEWSKIAKPQAQHADPCLDQTVGQP